MTLEYDGISALVLEQCSDLQMIYLNKTSPELVKSLSVTDNTGMVRGRAILSALPALDATRWPPCPDLKGLCAPSHLVALARLCPKGHSAGSWEWCEAPTLAHSASKPLYPAPWASPGGVSMPCLLCIDMEDACRRDSLVRKV